MQTIAEIAVPALYCPFPSAINRHVSDAEAHTMFWLQRFRLVQSQPKLEDYRQQGFAYMVARMFPTASRNMLFAFTDLNTLLFLVDDQFDHQEGITGSIPSVEDLYAFIRGFIAVLETDRLITHDSDGPVYAALADFWRRVKAKSTSAWQEQFIEGMRQIFKAAIWQYENTKAGKALTEEDYIGRRQYLGAANVATDTITLAENIFLPEEVFHSPIVQQLTTLCRNTVCWANDLFSLSKEMSHEDEYNMVSILQKTRNISLEQAIHETALIHDSEVREFISLAGRVYLRDDMNNRNLRRYIRSLAAIMRGNIDWSRQETTRYRFEYGEELQMP